METENTRIVLNHVSSTLSCEADKNCQGSWGKLFQHLQYNDSSIFYCISSISSITPRFSKLFFVLLNFDHNISNNMFDSKYWVLYVTSIYGL